MQHLGALVDELALLAQLKRILGGSEERTLAALLDAVDARPRPYND
jgi:hypothetical protein